MRTARAQCVSASVVSGFRRLNDDLGCGFLNRHGRAESAPQALVMLGKFPCDKQTCDMEPEPIILDSVYRHGVPEEAMLDALRFPVRHFVQDDSMTMFIGPDETGTLGEVGVIEWHGVNASAHAMRPARTEYLR